MFRLICLVVFPENWMIWQRLEWNTGICVLQEPVQVCRLAGSRRQVTFGRSRTEHHTQTEWKRRKKAHKERVSRRGLYFSFLEFCYTVQHLGFIMDARAFIFDSGHHFLSIIMMQISENLMPGKWKTHCPSIIILQREKSRVKLSKSLNLFSVITYEWSTFIFETNKQKTNFYLFFPTSFPEDIFSQISPAEISLLWVSNRSTLWKSRCKGKD